MKVDLEVRGMRDYFPEIYFRLNRIFSVWRETALLYGFEEFDGPIIETLDLYRIKSGEEIVRQLYNFTDKGGRELALRPELTPTVARMVSKIQNEVAKPIKWFSIPRCLRYEKPQKGRLREFFQLNVDIIGEEAPTADLEVIGCAADSLANLGLGPDDFVVKINSRTYVSGFFSSLGITGEVMGRLYKIVDNARKAGPEATKGSLDELGLTGTQRKEVDAYLSAESMADVKRVGARNPGAGELVELFDLIDASGFGPYCDFDPTIVRGLDYYTGIVFEIFDRKETMRAICGGGRYNRLLSEFAGGDVPACGFGMGDVVLGRILEEAGLMPDYDRHIDYYLVRVTDGELGPLLRAARVLRRDGNRVEYTYGNIPLKKQMARASKLGARRALIFGEDELRQGKVKEKDLSSGEERLADSGSSAGFYARLFGGSTGVG